MVYTDLHCLLQLVATVTLKGLVKAQITYINRKAVNTCLRAARGYSAPLGKGAEYWEMRDEVKSAIGEKGLGEMDKKQLTVIEYMRFERGVEYTRQWLYDALDAYNPPTRTREVLALIKQNLLIGGQIETFLKARLLEKVKVAIAAELLPVAEAKPKAKSKKSHDARKAKSKKVKKKTKTMVPPTA